MSGAALTGANAHQLTGRKRQSWRPSPRDQIRAAWSKIDERRGIRRDQLDAMEEVWTWLCRAARQDGTREQPASYVLRSVPQIVKGLGWEPMPTIRLTSSRYRNQVHRRLEYLQRIGWVESVEPVYAANGEGRGILIRLTPAGVAQSVQAALPRLQDRGALRTAGHPRAACRRRFLRGQVSSPLREFSACEGSKSGGHSTDVTRRAPVARASRRNRWGDADWRRWRGLRAAPRSAPVAARGGEEVVDPRRAAVARALDVASRQDRLEPPGGYGESWWKAQGLL